jgi:hypothetical protein
MLHFLTQVRIKPTYYILKYFLNPFSYTKIPIKPNFTILKYLLNPHAEHVLPALLQVPVQRVAARTASQYQVKHTHTHTHIHTHIYTHTYTQHTTNKHTHIHTHTHNTQHTNTQHTNIYNIITYTHTTYDIRHTTYDIRHTTYNIRHTNSKSVVHFVASNVDILAELPVISRQIHFPYPPLLPLCEGVDAGLVGVEGVVGVVGVVGVEDLVGVEDVGGVVDYTFKQYTLEEFRSQPPYHDTPYHDTVIHTDTHTVIHSVIQTQVETATAGVGVGVEAGAEGVEEAEEAEALSARSDISESVPPPLPPLPLPLATLDTHRHSVEFTAPGDLRVVREEVPLLLEGEVRIRTACTLVSTGTELKVFSGDISEAEPLDLTIQGMSNKAPQYPVRYGYSLVGTVEAVGAGVDEADWLGQRVFAFSPHSTVAITQASSVLLIPPDVSFEDAAFLPSVETAVSLVMAAKPMLGERVGVMGQGLIGQLTALVLKV